MRNKIFLTVLMIALSLSVIRSASAAENSLGLDDQNHYDIYIASYNDALTVLRDVDIMLIKEIAGQTFLLVRTDTFNAKRSEGLIAFSSIRAILPANRGNIQLIQPDTTTSRIKYFTPQ